MHVITEVTGLPCAHKLNNYGNKDRLEKYSLQWPGSTTILECSGLIKKSVALMIPLGRGIKEKTMGEIEDALAKPRRSCTETEPKQP